MCEFEPLEAWTGVPLALRDAKNEVKPRLAHAMSRTFFLFFLQRFYHCAMTARTQSSTGWATARNGGGEYVIGGRSRRKVVEQRHRPEARGISCPNDIFLSRRHCSPAEKVVVRDFSKSWKGASQTLSINFKILGKYPPHTLSPCLLFLHIRTYIIYLVHIYIYIYI